MWWAVLNFENNFSIHSFFPRLQYCYIITSFSLTAIGPLESRHILDQTAQKLCVWLCVWDFELHSLVFCCTAATFTYICTINKSQGWEGKKDIRIFFYYSANIAILAGHKKWTNLLIRLKLIKGAGTLFHVLPAQYVFLHLYLVVFVTLGICYCFIIFFVKLV